MTSPQLSDYMADPKFQMHVTEVLAKVQILAPLSFPSPEARAIANRLSADELIELKRLHPERLVYAFVKYTAEQISLYLSNSKIFQNLGPFDLVVETLEQIDYTVREAVTSARVAQATIQGEVDLSNIENIAIVIRATPTPGTTERMIQIFKNALLPGLALVGVATAVTYYPLIASYLGSLVTTPSDTIGLENLKTCEEKNTDLQLMSFTETNRNVTNANTTSENTQKSTTSVELGQRIEPLKDINEQDSARQQQPWYKKIRVVAPFALLGTGAASYLLYRRMPTNLLTPPLSKHSVSRLAERNIENKININKN